MDDGWKYRKYRKCTLMDDGWWMMDDGWKYGKYTLMDDRWWKKIQIVQKEQIFRKYRKYTLMDDGWKYRK